MQNSVERLLNEARNGNAEAGNDIFERFADRVRRFARSRLNGPLGSKLSADDIVQSVFRSFFRCNQDNRLSFDDWESVWSLLVTMAARKCQRKRQYFHRQKRDVRRETSLSVDKAVPSSAQALAPTPDEIVAVRDTVDWALGGLTEFQQDVVLLRLANFSPGEIATLIGRTERTVQRILNKFRTRILTQL